MHLETGIFDFFGRTRKPRVSRVFYFWRLGIHGIICLWFLVLPNLNNKINLMLFLCYLISIQVFTHNYLKRTSYLHLPKTWAKNPPLQLSPFCLKTIFFEWKWSRMQSERTTKNPVTFLNFNLRKLLDVISDNISLKKHSYFFSVNAGAFNYREKSGYLG